VALQETQWKVQSAGKNEKQDVKNDGRERKTEGEGTKNEAKKSKKRNRQNKEKGIGEQKQEINERKVDKKRQVEPDATQTLQSRRHLDIVSPPSF
jgi:hypothetical protein